MTLMHWMWIAIGVIGITAVIKTAVLIHAEETNAIILPITEIGCIFLLKRPSARQPKQDRWYILQMTGTDSTTGNTGLTTRR